jgi:rod shape-determining protein MreD
MWLKYFLITLLFFIFALLQISFLPYVSMADAMPNMIFVLFFILIFFSRKEPGVFTTVMAGFFLDLLLPSYFGISIIALLMIYFFQAAADHFFRKDQHEHLVYYFIAMFSASFILYHALLYVCSVIFNFEFYVGQNVIMGLVYNLVFAIIGFYIYIKFIKQSSENQLKLL